MTFSRSILLFGLIVMVQAVTIKGTGATENAVESDAICTPLVLGTLAEKRPTAIAEFYRNVGTTVLARLAWLYSQAIADHPDLLTSKEAGVGLAVEGVFTQFGSRSTALLERRNLFLEKPFSRTLLAQLLRDAVPETAKNPTDPVGPVSINVHDFTRLDVEYLGLLAEALLWKEDHVAETAAWVVLNPLKIIRSSYRGRSGDELANEARLQTLELRHLIQARTDLLDEISKILSGDATSESVKRYTACLAPRAGQVSIDERFFALTRGTVAERKYRGVRRGDVWLRTFLRPKPKADRATDRLVPAGWGTSVSAAPVQNRAGTALPEQYTITLRPLFGLPPATFDALPAEDDKIRFPDFLARAQKVVEGLNAIRDVVRPASGFSPGEYLWFERVFMAYYLERRSGSLVMSYAMKLEAPENRAALATVERKFGESPLWKPWEETHPTRVAALVLRGIEVSRELSKKCGKRPAFSDERTKLLGMFIAGLLIDEEAAADVRSCTLSPATIDLLRGATRFSKSLNLTRAP